MNKQKQTELSAALEQAKNGNWKTADDILGGFGIEYVSCCGKELKYINLGDTYIETICAEGNNLPFVCSWGNWYEDVEQEYCQDNDVIRCGYCGEFTPMNEECWRDVVCECCGNCVAG